MCVDKLTQLVVDCMSTKDKRFLPMILSILGYFTALIVSLFIDQTFAIVFGTVGLLMMVLWFVVLDLLLD